MTVNEIRTEVTLTNKKWKNQLLVYSIASKYYQRLPVNQLKKKIQQAFKIDSNDGNKRKEDTTTM